MDQPGHHDRSDGSDLPAVTILVISYNYGHYLAGAIDSALAQDYPHVTVAVVDDGSTDSTGEVATSYGPLVTYLRKPNGGLSDARNYGASHCTTPYLVYLDADDRLKPDYVSSCIAVLQRSPEYSFVYTQLEYFGDRTGTSEFPPETSRRLIRGNTLNSCALLPTDLVRRFPYDTKLRAGLEDWDFYLSLQERGYRGKLNPDTAVQYRVHTSSMGAGVQRKRWARRRTYARILRKHIHYIGMDGLAGFARRYLRNLGPRLRGLVRRRPADG